MKFKIAIIGAGNGGVSIGSFLALSGCSVNLYDKFEGVLEAIKTKGGVNLKGVSLNGFAEFNCVTSDLREAVSDCSLIMVIAPAFAHKPLAAEMAPFLTEGQIVVLNPGRTAGAIEFERTVREINPVADFVPAECQTLIYACRLTAPAEATIYNVKNSVSVAALPASKTDEVLKVLNKYYPQFEKAENVLETSLLNIGSIFHPAPAVLNIARIEGKEDFEYYMNGITPCVSNVLEKIDSERMAVAKAMEVESISVKQWLKDVYDVKIEQDDSIYDAVQKQSGYRGISAPKDPYARYITEDVPMSLVPLSELGRAFGVETPAMDSVIAMAGFLHNTDYRSKGRNLDNLGLKGVSLDKLKNFVNEGIRF